MVMVGVVLGAFTLLPIAASANDAAPSAATASAAHPATPLRFAVIPELLARGHHGAPAEGPYAVTVTVEGIDARTKRPWTTSFYATTFAFTREVDANKQSKPPLLTLAHAASADPTDVTPIMAAVTRGDVLSKVTLAFRPYGTAARGTPHVLTMNDLKLTSMKHVRGRAAGDTDREEIGVQFRHIVWAWTEGAKTLHDEWRMPHGHVGA